MEPIQLNNSVSSIFTQKLPNSPNTTPYESQKSFASVLKKSIEEINTTQQESATMTQKLALGENVDLHNVMITSQKASITLQAAMEVRNKAVEAYQEIMRMSM
ncbi:flagellar hook-basal body complex protein FliE [Pradoshia sp. D12]|uniref:flagellar hook-basal body complex protein FliE n=1 Tax=Bacillaceae TaxID=186817 RepID=UPI00080ADE51|nr:MULTISPECIES: flagellar hook-basal body complex protein FliE [Bacillaceae]OCA89628.1 flagellar hook-basal body complex protein FliE [Bacillus sp. FJAT-27986]QFK70975.1 flagellar hook-basal body complex protein FliE [Pradoshia sp. D12]TPF72767.1 flagellar hook-basal body complex protein FliE [Bacillus sp. D12]